MEPQLTDHDLAKQLMLYTGKVAWPTIFLFGICFISFIMFSILGAMHVIPLWIVMICNTILAYLLFTPLHEAGHRNIKGKQRHLKWLEDGIGWASGLVLMAPFPMFRYLHNVHHKHTNDPINDPDFWVASQNYVMLFVKCMTIYFDYLYHYVRAIPELMSKKKSRKEFLISAISFIIIETCIVWTGISYGWVYPLFIWVFPGLLALAVLAFAFDWLPHHPHAIRQKYLDTRIILKPGLTTLLVSQNMHLIHHLYSGIPYYHYGNAYRILKDQLKEKGSRIDERVNESH